MPNSQDILQLLGKWLFYYALNKSPSESLDSRNQSLKILSKVFRKSCGPYQEESLLKFYQIVLNILTPTTPI